MSRLGRLIIAKGKEGIDHVDFPILAVMMGLRKHDLGPLGI